MKSSAPHATADRADLPAAGQGAAMVDNRAVAVAQRQALAAIDNSPRQVAQRQQAAAAAPPRNTTGLPDNLKAGVENLSGYSFDDVTVHYNSAKPAQLQAHAYAQGTDIHVAPGQEKHLPHEAWHVVQQKQGRVRATRQLKIGAQINDDASLESEADVMGTKALQLQHPQTSAPAQAIASNAGRGATASATVQAVFSQNPAQKSQTSHHGGVKSDYTTSTNLIELHIEVGANANGNLMPDFLAALWEARNTIDAGHERNAGGLFMRPGGAKVLKMTMEMLGEALGQGASLAAAKAAQGMRKANKAPMGTGIAADKLDDTLDSTLVVEHQHYRDSLVGVQGIEIKPIGGGVSHGTEDMLANANERSRYDTALAALTPLALAVTINLQNVNNLITRMERDISWWKLLALKAKFRVKG